MPRLIYFITHPDVDVDPTVPVPRWSLSQRGRERMTRLLRRSWVAELEAIFCSSEQKALDGASILAEHCRLAYDAIPELGENDRSTTGFLPNAEFQVVADAFFAQPDVNVRGWERASDAQARIVRAVLALAQSARGKGPVAVVSHGAVGALLLCHLRRVPISRSHEQPGTNGGHYFVFEHPPTKLVQGWAAIDAD